MRQFSRWAMAASAFLLLSTCAEAQTNETPTALSEQEKENILLAHKKALSDVGDYEQCTLAVKQVRLALAQDVRLTDRDLHAEIDHFEKIKGKIPYPSPATACALFGFQNALHGALDDRRGK